MLASTADELLTLFRLEVSDQASTPLWSDVEFYAWATEGADVILDRAEVMHKVLQLPVTPGQPVVPLPAKVLTIREARMVSVNRRLTPRNANSPDFGLTDDYGLQKTDGSAMFSDAQGTPHSYVRDYETRALRLIPVPNAADFLEIQCSVTLSAPLGDGMPLPFASAQDQRLLLTYVKWRAYEKHDAETEDLVRASRYQRQFYEGVEDRKSRLRSQRRAPGTVRMEW